jgi:death-on-curing protein
MIKYLTIEQVLKLHDAVVEKFGGLAGIRDQNLLLSCIESPKMFGEDLYPYDMFHITAKKNF